RPAIAVALVLVAYLETGRLFERYNPMTEDRFFFPATPQLTALKQQVGRERVAVLGTDTIPPDANMAYRLSMIASYDGLWIRRYDRLYRAIFGEGDNWRPTLRATGKG